MRRDRKASAWQGLQAGPSPTAAPLPGRLGVPGSSRRASKLSVHCLHQQVPPPSPYGALARPRLGSLPSSPPLGQPAEPAGRGEPRRASSTLGERDPVSRGPQPNLSKRTREPTGGLAHSLRDSPRVTPRTLGSAHEVAAARTRPRPPPRSHRRQH